MSSNSNRLIFIISAPSGTGKTTLIRRVMAQDSQLAFSVSHTTRPPRVGEQNGRDYYFVDRETFQRLIAADAFIEWARVYGELYGTSRHEIARLHQLGKDVVLDIDVQGARQVMKKLSPRMWVSIFILPPNMDTLRQRILSRGKDPLGRIEKRLNAAQEEIKAASNYNYHLVNDDLQKATLQLQNIIRKERIHRGVSYDLETGSVT